MVSWCFCIFTLRFAKRNVEFQPDCKQKCTIKPDVRFKDTCKQSDAEPANAAFYIEATAFIPSVSFNTHRMYMVWVAHGCVRTPDDLEGL